jgi:hypothetical protein
VSTTALCCSSDAIVVASLKPPSSVMSFHSASCSRYSAAFTSNSGRYWRSNGTPRICASASFSSSPSSSSAVPCCEDRLRGSGS